MFRTVYICSPYAGNTEKNVEMARGYCRFAYENDALPIAPHLLFPQFMDDDVQEEREDALWMGSELMSWCDELWVFGDWITVGMASEIAEAKSHKMRIRYFATNCAEIKK